MTSTSASSLPGTIPEHLAWADQIKEQHRHLQRAVVHDEAAETDTQKAAHEQDLDRWQTALAGAEAPSRLSAYAAAMHHLATRYWDPPDSVPEDLRQPASPSPLERGKNASSVPVERQDCSAGMKRPRCEEAVLTRATSEAPRHYSDRLGYCLTSTASYYLGELSTIYTASGGGSEGEADPSAAPPPDHTPVLSAGQTETKEIPVTSNQPSTSLLVPVGAVTYAQLPAVLARVVKPLRRTFFDSHSRMATGAEVGALVAACTPRSCATDDVITVGQCPSRYEEPTNQVATSLITELMRAQEMDTGWRRGPFTAWSAAMHYAMHPCEVSPPALWVLDVGSCYGPFLGKSLPRLGGLSAVPLRVTSMDLAPYLEEEMENNTRDIEGEGTSVPAPRVWQADWLQIRFFTEMERDAAGRSFGETEEKRDTAAMGDGEQASILPLAEEGRVGYAVLSHPSASAPAEGMHTSENPCTPLYATRSVRLASYDAVYFCLLLSYLPTPRLRFLACLHAFLALKEGGLLVVVSTRTQGSRRQNWMHTWSVALATIGFQRVQQSIQEKIVGMAYAKAAPSKTVSDALETSAGRAAWVASLMSTEAAEKGLRIMADDAPLRADL